MFSKSNVPRFNVKSGGVSPPSRRNSGTQIGGRGRSTTKKYGDIYQEKNELANTGSLVEMDNNSLPSRPKSMSADDSKIPITRGLLEKRTLSEIRKSTLTDKDANETVCIKSSKSNETCLTLGSNNSLTSRRNSSKSPSGIPVPVRHTNLSSARLNSATNAATTTTKKRPNSYRALDFEKRNLEIQYNSKIKQFQTIKAELLKKQSHAMELYKQMSTLKKRVKESEGKELPLEALRIVEYMDSKQRMSTGDSNILDLEEVKMIKKQLENTPAMLVEICRKIIDEKQDIIDRVFDDNGEWDQDELMMKIKRYKEENASVKSEIEEKLKVEEDKLTSLLKEWHSVTKLQPEMDEELRQELDVKLQETEHRLKQALGDLQFEKSKKLKENDKVRELERELAKYRERIKELMKNVDEEKTKVISQKEHQSSFEQKLKMAKGKIRDAETQKIDVEYKMEKLNNTMKKMEEQWRSKEIYYENRQKEMQKHIKAHEQTIAKFEKERSIVDARCDNVRADYQAREKGLKERIDELEESLTHAEDMIEVLRQEKDNVHTHYDYLKAQMDKMEVCHHSIFELCKKRPGIDDYDEPASSIKTDEEVALWTELEETKTSLRIAEEKLEIYKNEKERFMENIKINYHENQDIDSNPLLLEKESEITNLILENRSMRRTKDEIEQELEQKSVKIKALEDQIELYKNQETVLDNGALVLDLRNRFEKEVEQNAELQAQLNAIHHKLEESTTAVKDRDSMIKLHDCALVTTREKKKLLEGENSNLKQYVLQLKDKISWLHEQHNLKNKELLRMSNALDKKSSYIESIQLRVDKLEDKFKESTRRRLDLQQTISDLETELRAAQGELHKSAQREELQQFLGHVKNLFKYHAVPDSAQYNPMDSYLSCLHYDTRQLLNNVPNCFEDIDTSNECESDYLL
ncbi:hypothetical protein CBL_01071 [Carabus blaptoides fortunei]